MTDTLTIPAHGLRKYERDGEVTVLLPIEPQPEPHSKINQLYVDLFAPFKVGDVVRVKTAERRVVLHVKDCIEYSFAYPTVLSCDAVKVAEMTAEQCVACGFVNDGGGDYCIDGMSVAQVRLMDWREREKPSFSSVHAWAVKVQRERKDDGTNGDL